MNSNVTKKKILTVVVVLVSLIPMVLICQKVYQYNAHYWLPTYFIDQKNNELDEIEDGHVMFLIVDHHEPGSGKKGIKISKDWCDAYKQNILGISDDYGNSIKYTWFYPYDHKNGAVLLNLNDLVFSGFGEIEFHWHHGNDTNETFNDKLKEALNWFNSYGCMTSGESGETSKFGFVHGNWALDNSGENKHCGVSLELDILNKHGCYADFTFSNLSRSQPKKINSIYYAKDTPQPKSYNTGVDSEVGKIGEGLMIFEGPISCDWHDLSFDSGQIEIDSPFKQHRTELWLKYAPTVKAKPNWLFVKVYTHGVQSKDVILSKNFRNMFLSLKTFCKNRDFKLHFVTAREAYNIVTAAEKGEIGDPEIYRDYKIGKPLNRRTLINTRIHHVNAM